MSDYKDGVIEELAKMVIQLRVGLAQVQQLHDESSEAIQFELDKLKIQIDALLEERDFFMERSKELAEAVNWYHTKFPFSEWHEMSVN
jgi:hypothetical protein